MSDKEQDKDPGFGYREILTVFVVMDNDLEKNILLSRMIVLTVVEVLDEGSFIVKKVKRHE